jgi:integrase/recombinase XerD
MREQPYDGLSLFGHSGNRKYLNAAERQGFIKAARRAEPETRLFCLTLGWSGGRISEVLALTPAAIDIESGVASILTLKRRKRGIFRQVPLPNNLLRELDRVFELTMQQHDAELAAKRIWRFSRTTAWRRVKAIMTVAGITGTPAMPKGLRHGFGVNAFLSNCRRISFNAGSAMPRYGRPQSMAMLLVLRNVHLQSGCGNRGQTNVCGRYTYKLTSSRRTIRRVALLFCFVLRVRRKVSQRQP